jgi:magnesium-protoporphyrin O-methyltransferase
MKTRFGPGSRSELEIAAAACHCDGLDTGFDEAYAAEKLAAYRSHGPDRSTRALIEAISAEDVAGLTLLDIGGGVGAVQHGLLERGVVSAQEVEASAAYVAACRTEAEARGHADRISHLSGDFASVRDKLAPADIVTLDRSICCWPEPLALIDGSAGMARRLYGLVYPRDTWWVRYGWRSWGNIRQLIKGTGLRLMTPRSAQVEAILASHGLFLLRHATVGVWQIALFAREAPAPDA